MNEVLLVEGTEELQPLVEGLQRAGMRVSACPLADAAQRLAEGDPPAALLLNLTGEPPDGDVRSLLRRERLPSNTVAVAIVRQGQLERLDPALAIDDLLVYPATAEELVARVRRAMWRRAGPDSSELLRCGDLVIDQASYRVFVAGQPVELTYKEYELLRFLALNGDKVCSRETLLNRVWGYDFYGGARTVDVHIRRLRSKIEDRHSTFIGTVRNVGYRFHAG